jgi:hypothetical protein
MTYTLTLLNEGQVLNYVDTFIGSRAAALARAKYLVVGLHKMLPGGSFSCAVQSSRELRIDSGTVVYKDGMSRTKPGHLLGL